MMANVTEEEVAIAIATAAKTKFNKIKKLSTMPILNAF